MSAGAGDLRDLRRRQIVAAARRIVAKGGLEALTMSALEERLDFTRGAITHHFAGKDAIVDAVLESALAEIDEATMVAVNAGRSFEERLGAVIRATITGFLRHKDACAVLVSFWGRMPADRTASRRNAALFSRYRAQSAELLRAARRAGVLARAVDVDDVATLLVGMTLGVVMQALFAPRAIDVESAVAGATEMMHHWLRAPTCAEASGARRGNGHAAA